MNKIYVTNSRGDKEPFSFNKVYQSARRVGASRSLAKKIATFIKRDIYSGITTTEIFKKVKNQLDYYLPRSAIKFNLKEGMKKLGPTGFPFEKYMREIFIRNGFKVKINQYIPGLCCSYEIDFLAQREDLLYVGECKYRNLIQGMVHLETALANYARFLDIKNGKLFNKLSDKIKIKSLIVTNAKFTKEAIEYSGCVGVHLLGWKHPKGKGLEYLIDKQELYPITILPSLKPYLANIFASREIMLVEDILRINIKKFIRITKIKKRDLEHLIEEAKALLSK